MKLIMENWKKFLNSKKETLEERWQVVSCPERWDDRGTQVKCRHCWDGGPENRGYGEYRDMCMYLVRAEAAGIDIAQERANKSVDDIYQLLKTGYVNRYALDRNGNPEKVKPFKVVFEYGAKRVLEVTKNATSPYPKEGIR